MPRQLTAYRVFIELDGFPTEQVLGVHLPDLLEVNRSLDDLYKAGNDLEGHTRVTAQRHHPAHELPRTRGDGNNRLLDPFAAGNVQQLTAPPKDGEALDRLPVQGLVIIQVSDDVQAGFPVRLDLVDNHPAGFAGADYDNAL